MQRTLNKQRENINDKGRLGLARDSNIASIDRLVGPIKELFLYLKAHPGQIPTLFQSSELLGITQKKIYISCLNILPLAALLAF